MKEKIMEIDEILNEIERFYAKEFPADMETRIHFEKLLQQYVDGACKNFGCFIHRENAKAIEGGLGAIGKLPNSIDEWFDDWKCIESNLSKQL